MDVAFLGALYEEDALAQIIYASDVTVSPGKVGLSAIHSMMYGTPVISHDNLDNQMPEVEAIVEGRSGSLFTEGDAASLAEKIKVWKKSDSERRMTQAFCVDIIRSKYNPENQAMIINKVISEVVNAA